MVSSTLNKIILGCLGVTLLAGCAGEQAFHAGEKLVRQARYDEAVYQYTEAVRFNPDSNEYRMKLFATRNRAALEHLGLARDLLEREEYLAAISEYRQAVALDPSLETATQEMHGVEERLKAERLVEEARLFLRDRRYHQAKLSLDQALLLVPDHAAGRDLLQEVRQAGSTVIDGYQLETGSTEPITLKFKEAKVRDVFGILSELSGITFIFDEKVDAKRINLQLDGATFSQALELLLKMNEMAMRVLNPKTVILYPKTKDKEKQYEDQVIQTFYLSNIDAKKAVNLLRTMLQMRKVYVHEELNALVVRDNPQVIRLAQQIIEAADRADSEVVFDLELVSVSGSDAQTIGAQFSTYSIAAGLAGPAGTIVSSSLPADGSTLRLVDSLNGLQTFYTLPSASFDFAKTLTSAETLANPKLRVKNKGKAKIHVGTREPIVTTTTGTDGNITSTNIQYVDVGTKLDIEPVIQLDNSVTTKLSLEVSQVLERQEVGQGNIALQIQTTNAQTELSLKDGERTVLGGLLQDNNSKTKKTFPWLGEIPLLGDLISHHDTTDQKREILLSITPHIVKKVDLPKADVASIWSGGEDELRVGPSLSSFARLLDAEQIKQPPAVVPARTAVAHEAPAVVAVEEGPGVGDSLAVVEPSAAPVVESAIARDEWPAEPEPDVQPFEPEAPVDLVEMPPGEIESAPAASRTYLDGPALVNSGEELVLTVMVSEVEQLFSAPLFVAYDAELLDFLRIEEGDFLSQTAGETVLTASADPVQGRLIIGYKQAAGGMGVSGSGELYRLVFVARQPGVATVSLEGINYQDSAGTPLPMSAEGLQVEIQ